MSLDPELVGDVAVELGVDPGFIEKDWHAVQVLAAIAAHMHDSITTVFCGGTNLSKAYGLIKRFSEDLDFRAQFLSDDPETRIRSARRQFRVEIATLLESLDTIANKKLEPDAGSNYFKFALDYPSEAEQSSALRPGLKVEYSFTQPRLDLEPRPVQSFISEFQDREPEAEILCLSPVETAADKLSALTWRVLRRNRSDSKDDPTIIRHLHDLWALEAIIAGSSSKFADIVHASFETDQQSEKRKTELGLQESMKAVFVELRDDSEYQNEYTRFVDTMSYADDAEAIDFRQALEHLDRLIAYFE